MKNSEKIFNVPFFGKLFATLISGEDGNPILRWASNPPGLSVFDKTENAFENADQAAAEAAALEIWAIAQKYQNSERQASKKQAPEIEFQKLVAPWMQACFGPEISFNSMERNHRFFEESTELVQANGMTRSEAHQLVDYTFDRPVGDLPQEVGGVMVTLAALCLAADLNMHAAGEVELARIWKKIEKIRKKQAAKPKHFPLPEAAASLTNKTVQNKEQLLREALCALIVAEAGLADIGDSDREPGDDLQWCEVRAAQALELPRKVIEALRAAI